MSSFERFISTKAYEWKRKQMRVRERQSRYQGQSEIKPIQSHSMPIKKPQIVAFSVGQVEQGPKERMSKRRVQAYQQVRLKKIIGIGLMALGVLLLLTKCFASTQEEVDSEVAQNQVIQVGNKNEIEQPLNVTFQGVLQDFINDSQLIEELFDVSLKYKQEYAHTFSVWALQRFAGIHDKDILKTFHRVRVTDDLIEFGLYEDGKSFFEQFIYDLEVFPVENKKNYTYENGWKHDRQYKGQRKHYGVDIMATRDKEISILSMSDGVVEQVGWNEVGGYRVGIRSNGGAYFYYAHLKEKPTHIKKGDYITAGTPIGIMGDTGYGQEGTRGKFPVHLHFGIAAATGDNKEFWFNPYGILRYLEDK